MDISRVIRLYRLWDSKVRRNSTWKTPEDFIRWADRHYEDGQKVYRLDTEKPYSPENARFGTQSHCMITKKAHRDTHTGIKGVSYDIHYGQYRAHLTVDGKCYQGLRRDSMDDAVRDRQRLERKYHQPKIASGN
jgi:hypothetical protein